MPKTTLSIAELLDQLKKDQTPFPKCFYANELGVAAAKTREPHAIMALCDLLNSPDPSLQFAAYGHLSTHLANEPGAEAALKAFEADPKNFDLIERFLTRNTPSAAPA